MPSLSPLALSEYLTSVAPLLEGRHLSEPTLVSPRLISFRISGKQGYLNISLEPSCPLLFLSQEGWNLPSLTDRFFESLKRELGNPRVISISSSPDDRIVFLSLSALDKVYKERRLTLAIELFPSKPNVLLLDDESKIVLVRSPEPLEGKRPLMKGLIYAKPEMAPSISNDRYSDDLFFELSEKARKTALENRRIARFGPLISSSKAKAKRAQRKIEAIERDIEEAKRHLDDGLMGDAIYMNLETLEKEGTASFEYEGRTIAIDPRYSLSQNAERYYKRAKKAKETIARGEKNLERAKDELLDANGLWAHLTQASEPALEEYAAKEGYFLRRNKKTGDVPFGGASLPYEIELEGSSILFGKNARQNEVLTFQLMTSPKHRWFHAMGDHGSHLILRSDSPSEREITLAAEIALWAAGKEDGDVHMALRKNVRKGKSRGEAVILKGETIHIKSVSQEAKGLYHKAHRWKGR